MNLTEYFEQKQGTGILATSDAEGNVDMAVYARPHVIDDKTVVFLMHENLSLRNLQSNPKAAYLFMEKTEGYDGMRLYIEKTKDQSDPELAAELSRRSRGECPEQMYDGVHVVTFIIERTRPLVGD